MGPASAVTLGKVAPWQHYRAGRCQVPVAAQIPNETIWRVSASTSDPAAPSKPRGMRGSAKSMVISMIVVIAAILVWLAFTPRVNSVSQPVADVGGIAREIGKQQGWNLAYATGLPEQWQPVNVRLLTFENQKPTWQAGYDGPGSAYAAVLQTKGGDDAWTQMQVAHGSKQGTVTIGGAQWTKYDSTVKGQKSLVRDQPLGGLSTVVIGLTDWQQLQTFAAAVHPQK